MISAANTLAEQVGVAGACRALRLPRSALYRGRAASRVCSLPPPAATPARRPPLALSELERRLALDVLNSPRFANCAPAAIHAQLLDEGRYVASVRTMYRLLQGCAAVRERRDQLRHPAYAKPELLAVVPNAAAAKAAHCGLDQPAANGEKSCLRPEIQTLKDLLRCFKFIDTFRSSRHESA